MPAASNGSKYDVIVIGGGHNGLTNAAYLAKAGKKVLVLERRHILRVLETTGGNMTAAAKRLGVDRGTLHRKMQQWEGHGAQMGSA